MMGALGPTIAKCSTAFSSCCARARLAADDVSDMGWPEVTDESRECKAGGHAQQRRASSEIRLAIRQKGNATVVSMADPLSVGSWEKPHPFTGRHENIEAGSRCRRSSSTTTRLSTKSEFPPVSSRDHSLKIALCGRRDRVKLRPTPKRQTTSSAQYSVPHHARL
jgi:hypothetical protein